MENESKHSPILVVDDHADTVRLLARLLSMNGYAVHGAGSFNEAVQIAKRERCGLIITDVGLPDGSGFDLLGRLRAENPSLKGIAVTGFDGADFQRESRAAGYTAHLVKPI